jgi:hypothetical protein
MIDDGQQEPMRTSAAQMSRILGGVVLLRSRIEDRTPHDVISDGFSAIIAWANEQLVHYEMVLDPDRIEILAGLSKLAPEMVSALIPTFSSPDCIAVYRALWPQLERPMPTSRMHCVKALGVTICIWSDGTVSPILTELLPASPREGFSPGELGVELQLAAQNTWDTILRDGWRRLHDEMGTAFNQGLSYATLESCLFTDAVMKLFPEEHRRHYATLLGFLAQIARCLIIENSSSVVQAGVPAQQSLRLLSEDTGDGSGFA